ncbi:binding protein [Dorcoceras hygrometricum]|uniref:Binding protein n=1 Tax=Dorcoceras hygrometricum TaxID=472368 RepID=A0A2Z7A3E1_9LAMI|nr:binding protein [Dorcoceras hygrometricum]
MRIQLIYISTYINKYWDDRSRELCGPWLPASHGPGSNPRGNAICNAILLQSFRFYRSSVFNILIVIVHRLWMSSQTLEEFSRHDIVGASLERRPAGGLHLEFFVRRKGARLRDKRGAIARHQHRRRSASGRYPSATWHSIARPEASNRRPVAAQRRAERRCNGRPCRTSSAQYRAASTTHSNAAAAQSSRNECSRRATMPN